VFELFKEMKDNIEHLITVSNCRIGFEFSNHKFHVSREICGWRDETREITRLIRNYFDETQNIKGINIHNPYILDIIFNLLLSMSPPQKASKDNNDTPSLI